MSRDEHTVIVYQMNNEISRDNSCLMYIRELVAMLHFWRFRRNFQQISPDLDGKNRRSSNINNTQVSTTMKAFRSATFSSSFLLWDWARWRPRTTCCTREAQIRILLDTREPISDRTWSQELSELKSRPDKTSAMILQEAWHTYTGDNFKSLGLTTIYWSLCSVPE